MVTLCSLPRRFLFRHLSLLIFFVALKSIAASDSDVYSLCSNQGSVTANSVYQANINATLSYLASNSSSNSRFYNTTVGFGDDKVYGLYFCLGDGSDSVCQQCVSPATVAMGTRCLGQKDAELWYSDKCMVRYSNTPFLSTMTSNRQNSLKIQDVTRNTTGFNQVLHNTLEVAANEATVGKRIATKEGNIADNLRNLTTIYTLVECSPDITVSDCRSCLQTTIGNTTKLCNVKAGCTLISLDCNLRYDTSPFYGEALEGSSVFSPSPTVYSRSTTYRGRRRKKRKVSVVVYIVVIAAVLIIVVMLVLLKCFCNKKAEPPQNGEEQPQNDEEQPQNDEEQSKNDEAKRP